MSGGKAVYMVFTANHLLPAATGMFIYSTAAQSQSLQFGSSARSLVGRWNGPNVTR